MPRSAFLTSLTLFPTPLPLDHFVQAQLVPCTTQMEKIPFCLWTFALAISLVWNAVPPAFNVYQPLISHNI